MPDEKEVVWMGTSLEDLRDFPLNARHDAGYQLEQVQFGLDPDDWKPMPDVGAGAREVRVKADDGAFRVGVKLYREAKAAYEREKREG